MIQELFLFYGIISRLGMSTFHSGAVNLEGDLGWTTTSSCTGALSSVKGGGLFGGGASY